MIKIHKDGKTYHVDKFEVTGVCRDGSRFKQIYDGTNLGAMTAMGINLWSGSVWGRLSGGQRVRLKRVEN